MAKSGTLRVRIVGDAAPFQKTLSGLGGKLKAFGKIAATGGLLAAGAMVKFGTSSVNAASELEQSVGAIESVFGPAAAKIEAFGDTAAESFGLSRREVNETASILGAQLQSMGFSAEDAADQVIGLQERAADMAATFGGTTTQALESIASLMRGERDPIEKYGVAIKQADVNAQLAAEGLDNLEGEAKKQAEAQAALTLLFDQTSNSAGQFGRESDTLAGKQARLTAKFENLRAEIGQKLMPIAVALFDRLSSMVDRVRPVLEGFFAGFSGNVNAAADSMRAGQDRAVEWGRRMRDVFDAVVAKIREWAGKVREFVETEVIPRIVRLKNAIADNGDRIQRIFDNVSRVISAVAGVFGQAFGTMVDSTTDSGTTIESVVDAMLGVIEGISDTVADVVEFVERTWPKIEAVIVPVLDVLTGDVEGLEGTFKRVFNAIGNFVAEKMAAIVNAIITSIEDTFDVLGGIPGFGGISVRLGRVSAPSVGSASGPSFRGSAGPGGRFHTGGIITPDLPRDPDLRPDERRIIGQVGERVQTVEQQRRQSGDVIQNFFGPVTEQLTGRAAALALRMA